MSVRLARSSSRCGEGREERGQHAMLSQGQVVSWGIACSSGAISTNQDAAQCRHLWSRTCA